MFKMDSTVYKYLFGKLEEEAHTCPGAFPLTAAPDGLSAPENLQAVGRFLRTLTDSVNRAPDAVPRLHADSDSFFGCLFCAAHDALADVVSGKDPQSHPFRVDGIQLTRFLVFCAAGGRDPAASLGDNEVTADAMACFLCEGLMHAGWCPNAFENEAKHAAHSYFIALKKSLHRADKEDLEMVIGYLKAAWLLSLKTEGVRADTQQNPDQWHSDSFTWKTESGHTTYIGVKRPVIGLFQILSKNHDILPHPFMCLKNDGRVGMKLHANLEPVLPVSLGDFMEIRRRKFEGHKLVYNCKCGTRTDIRWIVVFLNHESTTFRLDIVTFELATGPTCVEAEMRLESEAIPVTLGKNSFLANGPENTVIRFLDSPLEFKFERLEKHGISLFSSSLLLHENTLKTVTAWAKGRGITGINETTLLGMYD